MPVLRIYGHFRDVCQIRSDVLLKKNGLGNQHMAQAWSQVDPIQTHGSSQPHTSNQTTTSLFYMGKFTYFPRISQQTCQKSARKSPSWSQ